MLPGQGAGFAHRRAGTSHGGQHSEMDADVMFVSRARLTLWCACLFNFGVLAAGIWASDVLDQIVPDVPTATVGETSGCEMIAQDDENDEAALGRSVRRARSRVLIAPSPQLSMDMGFVRGEIFPGVGARRGGMPS